MITSNPGQEGPWAIIRDILAGMGGPGGEVHVEPDRKQSHPLGPWPGAAGDVIVLAGKGHETRSGGPRVSLPLDGAGGLAEYF